MRRFVVLLAFLAVCAASMQALGSGATEQRALPRPAVPTEPIGAILDAFRSYPIVALGERAHTGEQDQAFRVSLIRDPRFAATVNDIVVERGNARYQDLVDRFVRGEEVADEALRRVWQDTTGTTEEFDTPLSEELFRAVRAVNTSLPRERQLRVLLGDPPIEWENVQTFADLLKWGDERDAHAADLIRREVLAKQRRALVIYGRIHFQRKNERTNFETDNFLAGLLERDGVTKLFTIWTIGGTEDLMMLPRDVALWRAPSLTTLRGTTLGALDVTSYSPNDPRLARQGDRLAPISRDQWRPMPMEDQFDALLYLGQTLTFAQLPRARCADANYMDMRTRRMALASGERRPVEAILCDSGSAVD